MLAARCATSCARTRSRCRVARLGATFLACDQAYGSELDVVCFSPRHAPRRAGLVRRVSCSDDDGDEARAKSVDEPADDDDDVLDVDDDELLARSSESSSAATAILARVVNDDGRSSRALVRELVCIWSKLDKHHCNIEIRPRDERALRRALASARFRDRRARSRSNGATCCPPSSASASSLWVERVDLSLRYCCARTFRANERKSQQQT